jgi:hypothetical protein
MPKFNFTAKELVIFKRLNTPERIQDFLNRIPFNFERNGETLMSPRRVLRERKAHCLEGALLAGVAFWMHGEKPLLLDLKTTKDDSEHVVALFRRFGAWGAVSKTNHAVLRYREPVYASIRELVMSYFHEYFLDNGKKTLRSYSDPFDLSKLRNMDWLTGEKDLWYISKAIDKIPHHDILNKKQIRALRLAEKIEREAGKIVEWKNSQ